jgi:hypothetical protein
VLAVALAAFALARGSDLVLRIGVRGAGVAIVALAAALLLGWPRLVSLALVLLGGVYALYLGVDDPPLDVSAPAFAAGLLVAAELAFWSLDERAEVLGERGETLRRSAIVAGLGVAALVLCSALLALADVARTSGLAVDLLGAAAAVAVLLTLAAMTRR